MKSKEWRTVWLGNAVVLVLTGIIFLSGFFQALNYNLYDLNMKLSMTNEPHEDIVVIGINDKDLAEIGTFPWERNLYVTLLQKISSAKVIGFDITFGTNSKDRANDQRFVEELKKHKNIIIPVTGVTESLLSQSVKYDKNGMNVRDMSLPIEDIAKHSILAHINRLEDSDKGTRRTVLQIKHGDVIYPSLALQAARMYGADTSAYESRPTKQIHIRYDASSRDFMTVSFNDVLTGKIPPQTFKDRIVLIGFTAASDDKGLTPVDNSMYMVYAHANIINQMLQGTQSGLASDWVTIALILALLALTAVLTWRLKSIASVIYTFGTMLVLLFAQYYVFEITSYYVDTVYPITALILSFLTNIAMKTYYETKQKNFITKQFGRYISPELVKQIASTGQELQLGGINKELSVLFLDIRGFTTLSERLKAEEVVDFLNTMFDMITDRALRNHGTIDKFIGDAAMILFNAPLDVPNHPYYAVKTAWDIQQGMIDVRENIKAKYDITLSCGIGINTGDVVVGNIGSYLRVDYTAIGDNVNTAARIESQTTANQILVSEATYERVKDYFEMNFVAEKVMKGKTVGIKLYEIVGHIGAPAEEAASVTAAVSSQGQKVSSVL